MKKHKIEDIFSSMEDFSSVPPPELWGQIEEKLNKPKKKKRAILWWSAAACLLLGLLLPTVLHFTGSTQNNNLNNGGFENNSVVLDENTNHNNSVKNTESKENNHKTLDTTNDVSAKSELDNPETNHETETAVAHSDSKNKNTKNNSKTEDKINRNTPNQNFGNQSFIASGEKSAVASATKSSLGNNKKTSTKGISEERIAFGKPNKFNSTTQKQLSNSIFEEKIAPKSNKNFAFNTENAVVNNTTAKQNLSNSKNNTTEKTSSSIVKESSKFGSALTRQDSMQLAELQNLEKGILPVEEKKDKKEKKDKNPYLKERWAVAVFAGVANSENTRNEKTLGNVNDSKQSNSYGVKTKYNLNNKWAVSSGFKLNELGQSVANISYVSAKSNALIVPSADANGIANAVGNYDYVLISNSTKEALKNNDVQTGKLDQNLRYIEMPLEVSYSVFNRNKASINLNTGGFVGKLISNNVAIDGNSIGQNANANDYVYGSTLSSTVQYRVYKKTNVFVEPAVNYYINPLNNQSFNQFQWGLNFGLNVSF
ncbi:hypothetical protein K6T82_23410 [Flavobacterium sp. 17A]|uniref:Outer membrane protein beta-barrel domain-containing protein n=1 Tax=Flavobacterium potami TaxID=2872310 RepID=A0A9X1HEA7_9FLAO|nr:hypothetical protein [Flavobacterium potami]MBZ4037728.1 hypothetical protein [Flavobacterium potami]